MVKKPKMYLRMLMSYILILLIPLFLAGAIYSVTLNVFKSQSARLNENMLESVKQEVDQKVEDIRKISSRLAMNARVQKAALIKNQFDSSSQVMMYDIFKDINNLTVTEEFIDDAFIFFKNTRRISSMQGNMSLELYYHLYYENQNYPIDMFERYIEEVHYGDYIVLQKSTGEKTLLFTTSDLGVDVRDASATICIAVNFSKIDKMLKVMEWNSQIESFLINEQNEVIGGGTEELYLNYNELKNGMQDGNSILYVKSSNITDWKYVASMPIRLLEQEIVNVKKLAMLGLFACLAIGFVVSYYLTKINYNPIGSMLEVLKKYSNDDVSVGENEYKWLNNQMERFFKEQVDAKKLLHQNRKNLKAYYLSQLLQYTYEGSVETLYQYGIRLDGGWNRVLLFEFKDMEYKDDRFEACAQENAFCKFILINILEEMLLNEFMVEIVEMGEKIAVIVNQDSEDKKYDIILREHIEQIQRLTEEQFDFAFVTLLGPLIQGVEKIHFSWLEVQEMEVYITLLDADLVSFEEVKDIQPQYHYGVEEEKRIVNAIKAGDSKSAKESIGIIFADNLQKKSSTAVLRCLIYDMLGTLIKGAIAGGYTDIAKDVEFKQFSIKQPISKLEDNFYNTVDNICNNIKNKQKELDENYSFARDVERYIQENYQNSDLNISIASQHFELTPTYLSSVYKKQTGGSLLDYINSVRIDHAEELLRTGYGVQEAGGMTGFSDSSTFIRVFRKKRGITPGQMKKQISES